MDKPKVAYEVGKAMTGVIAQKGYTWRVARLWELAADKHHLEIENPGSWMGIPIVVNAEKMKEELIRVVGVVRLSREKGKGPFTEKEQSDCEKIICAYADKIAAVLDSVDDNLG